MSATPAEIDILVVGGGPAGAATALRAARLGHVVCLADRGANVWHRGFVQSLAPGVLPLLETLGVRDEIEARFRRAPGVRLLWGKNRPELRGDGGGSHIARAAFDAILRDAAARAGALVTQAAVTRVRRVGSGFAARLAGNGTAAELRAKIVVDAAGRRSPAARARAAPPLLALLGLWPDGLGGRSAVEAARDCWYWAGAAGDGEVTAAVFCDPRARLPHVPLHAAYRRLIEQSRLLRGLDGTPTQVTACDATSRHVRDPVEPGLVRVGEAALSLDPLSSQGIQTALVGALQAAIVANTWLRRPARAAAADAFYRDRHGETVARSASNASRLYAEAAGRFATPFWTQRVSPAPAPPVARRRRPAPDPSARLKLAPGVRVGRTAVVRDDLAEFTRAIVPAGAARPVAFVSEVPVGELAGRLVAGTQAVELVRMWSALVGEAAALNALTWMWQTGVVDGDAA